MNDSYTTAPFKIFRGVRQGDPLSPYLFIISLEILAINIRLNKDIHGIMVGNEEIKLEIFADDMTAFLRDHASLDTLLNMVDSFSLHSGLKINFEKTEVLFLGNNQESTMETVISLARNRNITAKKAIKILGVHFTYDQTLWRKLNFDETLKTIKERLNCWNWRNLTVLDWHDIYKLPFNVLIDTKSREFQYRILNRYLTTNSFLHKIGLANSPLCTFCKQESESLEHLLNYMFLY